MTGAFVLLAATAAASPVRTAELRNPFWPVEKYAKYAKQSEAISSEPIVEITRQEEGNTPRTAADAAAAAAEIEAREKSSKEVSRQTWAKAAATTLKISGRMIGKDGAAYQINGRVYAIGDYITTTYDGHRFTWRLRRGPETEDPPKPRFEQIRVVDLAE